MNVEQKPLPINSVQTMYSFHSRVTRESNGTKESWQRFEPLTPQLTFHHVNYYTTLCIDCLQRHVVNVESRDLGSAKGHLKQ